MKIGINMSIKGIAHVGGALAVGIFAVRIPIRIRKKKKLLQCGLPSKMKGWGVP